MLMCSKKAKPLTLNKKRQKQECKILRKHNGWNRYCEGAFGVQCSWLPRTQNLPLTLTLNPKCTSILADNRNRQTNKQGQISAHPHYWGWHPHPPLRTALCSILALHTAYRHFLASRTAYCLTTKTTILAVSIYMKKLKLQYVVCTCTVNLENI